MVYSFMNQRFILLLALSLSFTLENWVKADEQQVKNLIMINDTECQSTLFAVPAERFQETEEMDNLVRTITFIYKSSPLSSWFAIIDYREKEDPWHPEDHLMAVSEAEMKKYLNSTGYKKWAGKLYGDLKTFIKSRDRLKKVTPQSLGGMAWGDGTIYEHPLVKSHIVIRDKIMDDLKKRYFMTMIDESPDCD